MFNSNKFQKCVVVLVVIFLFCTIQLYAKPVDKEKAFKAAKTFLTVRYPTSDLKLAETITKKGKSAFKIKEIQPLVVSETIVGYVSEMEPSGFVLFSADDQAPPVKIYSDNGSFENLPSGLLRVLELELSEDSAILTDKKASKDISKIKNLPSIGIILLQIQVKLMMNLFQLLHQEQLSLQQHGIRMNLQFILSICLWRT